MPLYRELGSASCTPSLYAHQVMELKDQMTEGLNCSFSLCKTPYQSFLLPTDPCTLSTSVCFTINHFNAQLLKLSEIQTYVSYGFLSAETPISCLIVGASGIPQTSSVIILCIFNLKKSAPSRNIKFLKTSILKQT